MNHRFERFLKEEPFAHRTVCTWEWDKEQVKLYLSGPRWNEWGVQRYQEELKEFGFNTRVVSFEPGQRRGKQATLTLRFV